jgi:APA family basic amino acid/polyamine antiporter
MAVYVLVGVVAVGLLRPAGLAASGSPLDSAMSVTGNSLAVQIVSVGGLVATASVLLTAILGVSRMAYSMARRNDLPSALARVHHRFFTPYYAILTAGSLMTLLVLFVDLTPVVAVSTFALLFTYCIVNISAFKLKSDRKRNKILPVMGLATCIMLLVFILFASTQAWLVGIVFLTAGTVYYLLLKKLKRPDEKSGFRLR